MLIVIDYILKDTGTAPVCFDSVSVSRFLLLPESKRQGSRHA